MNRDKSDINIFLSKLVNGEPFTFSRFSDGETEVLNNRLLTIEGEEIYFRNTIIKYRYPEFDQKSFVPERDYLLRQDLLESLMFEDEAYFKGIPGSHNSVSDRNFYLELLGGNLRNVTLADIFVNDNYGFFIRKIMSFVKTKPSVIAVCNENARPKSFITDTVPIPTNAFPHYDEVMAQCMRALLSVPRGSIVLSSASSLSNILAVKLIKDRPDCTFLDLGSALNNYLGLDSVTRVYHIGVHGPRSLRDVKMYFKHLIKSKDRMTW